MCGIAGIVGPGCTRERLEAMVARQRHRGPDDEGLDVRAGEAVALGHNRLSIIDLSSAGRQPMPDHTGRYSIVFNGELYNYLELRAELRSYPFRTQTDTEVVLAAYSLWKERCIDRFIGMFAFALWDRDERTLFAARDRFGVKPFHYHVTPDGTLLFASEIKALHAAGAPRAPDEQTWAAYLKHGISDSGTRTFWRDIQSLPAGHTLRIRNGTVSTDCWYDLRDRLDGTMDPRPAAAVEEEYIELLRDNVRLRFRSDVPVGINLSGGLDSSTLLGVVHSLQGPGSDVKAFTFTTGDERYDELPWVRRMLEHTCHPSIVCELAAESVPDLALEVQRHQDEPFGGLPTLAYARLFARARQEGVIVLLDGQGMDEQWAGYDYYRGALAGLTAGVVQGTRERATRPECLRAEFSQLAPAPQWPAAFPDPLQNLQYRDIRYTKIPRALRFNDRASMQSSTELREPFLDHRLVELALRQPAERKVQRDTGKWLLRKMTESLLPGRLVEAPKRPLQTPQREWLRGPLRSWADDCINQALQAHGGSWLESKEVLRHWKSFVSGDGDNSFFVWQWINMGLMEQAATP
jgi:asparagine synthase (glutamine-hydrolysing)